MRYPHLFEVNILLFVLISFCFDNFNASLFLRTLLELFRTCWASSIKKLIKSLQTGLLSILRKRRIWWWWWSRNRSRSKRIKSKLQKIILISNLDVFVKSYFESVNYNLKRGAKGTSKHVIKVMLKDWLSILRLKLK